MLVKRIFITLILCLLLRPVLADTKNQQVNFLALSDIHFDPFVACQTVKERPCPMISKLRNAPVSAWPAIFAQYDQVPPAFRQDTNFPLLISALDAAKKAAQVKQAKYVIILGDFLGHRFRHYYKTYSGDKSFAGNQAFIKKTMAFIALELKRAFPTTDVYCVVGNNDSYTGDYRVDPNGAFFADTAATWAQLINTPSSRAALLNTFPKAGYYAVDAPLQPSLKLIMLNSVLLSHKAKGGSDLKSAALAELNWLHRELEEAKQKHQQVYILMHIPLGIDVYTTLKFHKLTIFSFWQAEYLRQFNQDLNDYADTIAAIFAGHLHADWYQVLDVGRGIPASGVPSMSPIFGNNPGFKIYSESLATGQLMDYVTYYYRIAAASQWNIEYSFTKIYQSDCHRCPIIKGMNALEPSSALAEIYKKFYSVNTDSQPIRAHWDPYYWCAIHKTSVRDYEMCTESAVH